MNSNHETVENLRWKKFPLLNDGFVCLVDAMGDDAAIVQAARVSYGKDVREGFAAVTKPGIEFENNLKKEDGNLLRYLMRHRHSTPFEMAEIKILIRVPMDCWRQMIRHRTANVNEYSTRYTEAIDSRQTTEPDAWRLQSKNNKQGSSENCLPKRHQYGMEDTETASYGDELTGDERNLHTYSQQVYERRIKAGVAKEVARKDLPLSTYTEAYWKCDLRNIFHFLGLRMDSHAQKEIRDYATVIGEEIVKPLFPQSYQAFLDYQFNAMTLTALDQEMIQRLPDWDTHNGFIPRSKNFYDFAPSIFGGFTDKPTREATECFDKLKRIGLVIE